MKEVRGMKGKKSRKKKPWTFMVYLAGDNNLTEEMVWGLQEIKKTSAKRDIQDNVNVVAHFDPRGSKGRRYNFTETDVFEPKTGTADGHLDVCEAAVYTDAFVNAALARQLAHEIAQSAATRGLVTAQEASCLGTMLATFFISSTETLKGAVGTGLNGAATALAAAFLEPDRMPTTLHPFDATSLDSLREKLKRAEDSAGSRSALRTSANDSLETHDATLTGLFREKLEKLEIGFQLAGDASKALAAFVEDQLRHLPDSERYFVVLSGHGSGATGDFLTDLNPEDSLSIPELARIIETAQDRFKDTRERTPPDPLIAVLGMDSCLMSTAEVCFEVRDHVGFLVGSEGWVQNTGWPYHRVLEALFESPRGKTTSAGKLGGVSRNARRVAERVAKNYSSFYRDYEISGVSTDIAVCDLSEFRDRQGKSPGPAPLVVALQEFCDWVIPRLEGLFAWETSSLHKEVNTRSEREARAQLVKDIRETSEGPSETSLSGKREVALDELQKSFAPALKGPASSEPVLLQVESKAELAVSQGRALWRVLDTFDKRCHTYDTDLRERLKKGAPRLRASFQTPRSLAEALALAAVAREFDPAILGTLDYVEALEACGHPHAKEIRRSLQKLHQIRWILGLSQLVELTKKSDKGQQRHRERRELRSALVAARFEAQSFKGGVYVDLLDFCQCLRERLPRNGDRFPEPSEMLRGHLEKAVVSSRTGTDFQHAHGLSVFFPVDAMDYAAEYEDLEFSAVTGWGRLVRAYLRATRRSRRDESTHWADLEQHLFRFNELEVDPLETDTIEARIAGAADRGDLIKPEDVVSGDAKHGTEKKIKFGTAKKIKFGTAKKIKHGTAKKIKGEGAPAIFGNPPDGFYAKRPRLQKPQA
jgi:hypothetical protein